MIVFTPSVMVLLLGGSSHRRGPSRQCYDGPRTGDVTDAGPRLAGGAFEASRTNLRAVAYRMLGSVTEADDAVEEAWLRLSLADTSDVENLGGWLTTIVARVCLDILRSRPSRREEPMTSRPARADRARRRRRRPRARGGGGRFGRCRQARRARHPRARSSTARWGSSGCSAGGRRWSSTSRSRTGPSSRSS